ncbi:MAG: formate dehydrogenase subunit delta [Hyphomicrobium sp.]|nr:formate dehydrogenase subunit delta [Hyphomicrobium sp.]
MQSSEKLVMMANQIARNLMVHGDDEAASLTADHIRKFWEPRMREQILGCLEHAAQWSRSRRPPWRVKHRTHSFERVRALSIWLLPASGHNRFR